MLLFHLIKNIGVALHHVFILLYFCIDAKSVYQDILTKYLNDYQKLLIYSFHEESKLN